MDRHNRKDERVFDASRVVYYEPNDWAAGESISRCQSLLRNVPEGTIRDINDAIEYAQCKKVVERYPKAFESEEHAHLLNNQIKASSEAFAFANQSIAQRGLSTLFENVESQYVNQFWDLLEDSNAIKQIKGDDFKTFFQFSSLLVADFPAPWEHQKIIWCIFGDCNAR